MRLNRLASILIAGFAVPSLLSCLDQPASAQPVSTQPASTQPASTQSTSTPPASTQSILQCVNTADSYATVIVNSDSNGTPLPLINFSSSVSPQQTCQTVTSRLNASLITSGSDWSTVLLRTGSIRKRTVICVVRSESTPCNTNNELLTVPSGQDPETFLRQLLTIPVQDSAVYSIGNPDQHTRRNAVLRFGATVRTQVPPPPQRPQPTPQRSRP